MKLLKLKYLALVPLAISSISAQAGSILLTQFDYSGYTDMKSNLESSGHTVDIVDARVSGNIASALSTGIYDQVFLWDLTASSYLTAIDINALGSFWNTSMGVVVDTRSYGYLFQGNDPSEVALIQNVADAFDLSGGGLWVGTDHDPSWTRNANPVLQSLGFDPVTGSYSEPVNIADPTSYLLNGVTPTDLWGGGQTVGQAPTGLQANGVTMYTHFGHQYSNGDLLPYISASFDLDGPVPVPEPGTLALLGLGLFSLAVGRRKRQ